ncbi:uncharacterized protein [Watersipora subatra]|uniref:uncharacterized protein n=1 Tax=Watersipora subatra TaxID=2589382 RepID=UPI00355BE3B4
MTYYTEELKALTENFIDSWNSSSSYYKKKLQEASIESRFVLMMQVRGKASTTDNAILVAAWVRDLTGLQLMLNGFTQAQKYEAFTFANNNGNTALHNVVQDRGTYDASSARCVEIVDYILSSISVDNGIRLLKQQAKSGNSVLHTAARSNNLAIMKYIFDRIPRQTREELLRMRNCLDISLADMSVPATISALAAIQTTVEYQKNELREYQRKGGKPKQSVDELLTMEFKQTDEVEQGIKGLQATVKEQKEEIEGYRERTQQLEQTVEYLVKKDLKHTEETSQLKKDFTADAEDIFVTHYRTSSSPTKGQLRHPTKDISVTHYRTSSSPTKGQLRHPTKDIFVTHYRTSSSPTIGHLRHPPKDIIVTQSRTLSFSNRTISSFTKRNYSYRTIHT